MPDAALLNAMLLLPVGGIAAVALARSEARVRSVSLAVMLAGLAIAAWLYVRFDPTVAGLQFRTRIPWIAAWGVHYDIGLDGLNLLLVLLTAFLGPIFVAGSFTGPRGMPPK